MIHDDFILRVISHPEWDVIEEELSIPDPDVATFDLGGGLKVLHGTGPDLTPEQIAKSNLWGSLNWYVNQGPGYCEEAPEEIKVYLRRLKAIP